MLKPGSHSIAIQVWSGNGEVHERELEGLHAGMKTAKAKGLLLVLNEPPEKYEGVDVMRLEDWLLK